MKYKKIAALFFVSLILLGVITPFHFSRAQFGLEILTAPAVWTAQKLTKLYFYVWISQYALRLGNGVLGWVTNPDFIADTGGYTKNQLVREGWTITRDLVNMFFILIMVAIGVATILRVKGYEIKKLLPKAIAIAILINFTPVICGVIIDAANILTNFFLSAGTRGVGAIINGTEGPQSTLAGLLNQLWEAVKSFDWKEIAFAMFSAIIVMVFNFTAAFILIILALLFLLRYIMLWILVILSPLAFFCYILPGTQKIWKTWWDQFIQWCFIGIGAAFFLYMAQRMVDIVGGMLLAPGTQETQLEEGLSIIFLYMVPLIFLLAGFTATTMFAPMGAKQIVNFAKRGAKYPWSKEGKKNRAKFDQWRKSKARNIPVIGPGVQKAMSKLSSYKPDWGQDPNKGTTASRWLKRQAATGVGKMASTAAAPGRWVFGEGAAASRRITDAAYAEASKQDLWTNLDKLKKATLEQKVGIVGAMAEEGQLKDAKKEGRLYTQDMIDVYKHAYSTNNSKVTKALDHALLHDEEAMKAFGKIKEEKNKPNGLSQEDREAGITTYQDKVLRSLSTEKDFKSINIDDPKLKEKLAEQALHYDARQLNQAGRILGNKFVDEVQKKTHEKGAAWFFEIDENTGKARNAALPRYLASTGAANLGYSPLAGASNKDEIRGLENQSRHWEDHINKAKGNMQDLADLEKTIKEEVESSEHESLKQIHESALRAVRRQRQIISAENIPTETETEQGKIILSDQAKEAEARRRREPNPEEIGEANKEAYRERTGRERREPGPDER